MLAWVKVSAFSLLKKKKKKEREKILGKEGNSLSRINVFFVWTVCTWGWYHGTAMVIMLYTMQSKVDRFFIAGNFFFLFSDSTVLVINPRTYMQIHTPTVVQGGWMDPPPWSFWYVAVFGNDFTFKVRDHGYAHTRLLFLQNKFVGSTLNSKSPLLVQSLQVLLFIPISVALAGLVVLW